MCALMLVISATGNVPSHGRVYETTDSQSAVERGTLLLAPTGQARTETRTAAGTARADGRQLPLSSQAELPTTHHGGIGTPAFSIPGESSVLPELAGQAGHEGDGGSAERHTADALSAPLRGLVRGAAMRPQAGTWWRSFGRGASMDDALSAARWLTGPTMYVRESGEESRDGAQLPVRVSRERVPDVYRGAEYDGADCYADILARYEWDVATMKAIFWRESNCQLDPPHYNLSRSICQAFGPVWQWLLDQYDWAHSPEQAIEMCHVIFARGGYAPWNP